MWHNCGAHEWLSLLTNIAQPVMKVCLMSVCFVSLKILHCYAMNTRLVFLATVDTKIEKLFCVALCFYCRISVSQQVNSLPADKLQEIQKAIELISVGQGPAKTMEEASRRSYQFWDTQPVPKLGMTPTFSFSAQNPQTIEVLFLCFTSNCFTFFQGRRWHHTAPLNLTKTTFERSPTASHRASAGTPSTWGTLMW